MATVYDVAVIGGGPAGYVAAIRAAQVGAKVVCFEKDVVGGTCLNRGCIPTKTFIKTAEYIETIKKAPTRGVNVDASTIKLDMPRIVEYKNQVVKKLTDGVASLLKSNACDLIAGEAKMIDKTHIECNGTVYEAKNTILCGGSVAGVIPIPGVDQPNVITSDAVLDLQEIPERLAIIGGGVIGCEIATAFSSFGSKVTVVEAVPKLVAMMDPDISAAVEKSLKAKGVTVYTNAKVEKIDRHGDKPVLCVEGKEPIEADKVLLSIGRFADLACLGKLADQIKQERKKIVVDEYMRTSIPNIYAAGDVVFGYPMLAHAAFKMGEVAAENCMGANRKADLHLVPSCLYTEPEGASLGMTEEQAKKDHEILVGKFFFQANGRALASGQGEGTIKVILDKKYHNFLGVHIVGGVATEMISEAVALMANEITADEVVEDMIHPHPTFSEAFGEAVADALGRCIHLPAKKK